MSQLNEDLQGAKVNQFQAKANYIRAKRSQMRRTVKIVRHKPCHEDTPTGHDNTFVVMPRCCWKEKATELTQARVNNERLREEIESAEKKAEDSFYQGWALLAAFIAKAHGEDLLVVDAFIDNGVTWEDLKEAGVANYDLRRIATALGQHGVRKIRRDDHA